ncbi:MAG: glycine zipper 2TM domain-containing protein [Comamonas sp.]|jgi:outer membrane lipoprotein SlyB|uniref:glycine zipper 2TM domain-containing protein n=1 Tax=Comamonas sp. TaxID=34028 RepID=UPI00282FEA5A|nr:glycine zipper 2TM domain-containing protein [Comamonas sp.]MDR0215843.1 glycine zipper 2TM domain-containing protein [Comamonas sp.]
MQAIQSLGRIVTVAAVAVALTACVAYPQGTYQNSYPMPQGGYQGAVYQGGHSGTGFPGAANAAYPTTSYPVGSYPAQTYPNNNCGLNRNGSGYGDNYGQQNGYDNNCYQYNNVQQARVLNIETVRVQDGSGIGAGGAIAGGVIGGVLGNQVGKGSGRTLATIAGVVGGALAGNAVQNSVGGGSVRDIYRVTVQMRDGSVRAFDYQQPPQLNIGEYVRVDGNQVYRQ